MEKNKKETFTVFLKEESEVVSTQIIFYAIKLFLQVVLYTLS